MVEYTFTWPKGPQEVVVTGNFDNWTGSLPLVKQPSGDFSLTMPLPPNDDDKFVFKFIVDGEWVVSDKYEKDSSAGPINNVIYTSKIVGTTTGSTFIPESALSAKTSQKPKSQPAPGSNKKGKKKKVKVKKRIRKDKRTGEQTVISEERTELNSDGEEESEEVSTTATNSKEVTPLPPQTATTEPADDEEATAPVPAVLPSKENQQTTLGEPGIAIVPNPNEIAAFKEVRNVDAQKLNEQLNAELKEKEADKKETLDQQAEETAAVTAAATAAAAENPTDDVAPVIQSATEPAVQTEQLEQEKAVAEPETVPTQDATIPNTHIESQVTDGSDVVEEVGIITSPEQEAELVQRTLDPKIGGEAELLIAEGEVPKDSIPAVQEQVEKIADEAIEANTKIADNVTEDVKKTAEEAKTTTNNAANKVTNNATSTNTPTKTAAKPEKKKKKGFFSKLKKIFN
ncbi:Mdg1p [Kluyveromyces lactis]|uniref:KLLA0D08184p n=1 Tax=Kluyveromyces lactis (strain ATCC 8585 / CBS 2359 / DSM 70799 / NBRC 1267 / NRRL Y-1140 / WM37) TaxID=284590 RepID=Q6CRL3_KLULA|nr:uncharacterized protein KLLA0_D08184g [Kluyveromyces lactis]CAH00522.1 KLLA0D08184p [Kluyveromyces lactis]|eukprot:XP_453426.1 uncharacterized protein KLLA0_D08184g [Kluyveromyces lactis]